MLRFWWNTYPWIAQKLCEYNLGQRPHHMKIIKLIKKKLTLDRKILH